MDILVLSIILAGAITLLVTQVIRFEVTSLLIIVALSVTGLLTPAEAMSGFANEATLMVAAMLIMSAGLLRTGALDFIVRRMEHMNLASSPTRLLLMLGLLAGIPSAVLNNTAVVVLLIPVVLSLCLKFRMQPSKVMIPLSFFTILGGTMTLIGTSTNILVHGLHRQAGGEGFRMFEFTPMGACYFLIGGAFLVLFGRRLLPERTVLSQLLEPQHRSNFVTEIAVTEGSKMDGATLEALLSGLEEVRILELVRGEDVRLGPDPDTTVQAGDNLLVEGSPKTIHKLLAKQGLDLASAVADEQRVKINRVDLFTVEAVVTPNSPFFNQLLSEIGLNRLYGIKVLAIQRMGRHLQARLRETKLLQGDVLLIQGEEQALRELQNTGNVLIIEGVDWTIRFSHKAPIAVAILAAVVVISAFGWLPVSVAALAGATAMILFRCMRFRGALRALDSATLLLLVGALPLGIAMQKTGMAELLARTVLGIARDHGPTALVSAMYLVTSILTAFLTNATTAAVLTPIVLEVAAEAGIAAKPLLVAIAFGASASFFTPIGYQTNLMVMGPGGYYFRDYLRIGLVLNFITWIAATILIPIFWPVHLG